MTRATDSERWPPRPLASTSFFKGHGLGNDYLVFEEAPPDRASSPPGAGWRVSPGNVVRVCDPHRGVGSDGIVVVGSDTRGGGGAGPVRVSLRMFNPDGGEFERSGNGLRVVAAFLAAGAPDVGVIDAEVGGDAVRMRVHGFADGTFDISVAMGTARSGPEAIDAESGLLVDADRAFEIVGPAHELLSVMPVSVGNPHLVVLADDAHPQPFTEERLAALGPFLAEHPRIPLGTNVQLARLADGSVGERGRSAGAGRAPRVEAYIWERGVGRTSASGTSACAVGVALVAAGRVPPGVIPVAMPGGTLTVTVGEDLDVLLRGPVASVMTGELAPGLLSTFERGA